MRGRSSTGGYSRAGLRAVEAAEGVRPAHLTLDDRVVGDALERLDAQAEWPRHAVQRQLTLDPCGRPAPETSEGAAVGRRGKVLDVEAIPVADLSAHRHLVELVVAEVDAGGIDHDFHRAGGEIGRASCRGRV